MTQMPTQTDTPAASLVGSLREFALPDVLRLLAAGHHTGEVLVVAGGTDGRLWVRGGDLNGAAVRGTGSVPQAVFELSLLEDGWFYFTAGRAAPEPVPATAVGDVLASVLPQVAEWRDLLRRVPLDATVHIAPAPPGANVQLTADQWQILAVVGNHGMRVVDLVAATGRDQVDTIRSVRTMADEGLVVVTGGTVALTRSQADTPPPPPPAEPYPSRARHAGTRQPAPGAAPAASAAPGAAPQAPGATPTAPGGAHPTAGPAGTPPGGAAANGSAAGAPGTPPGTPAPGAAPSRTAAVNPTSAGLPPATSTTQPVGATSVAAPVAPAAPAAPREATAQRGPAGLRDVPVAQDPPAQRDAPVAGAGPGSPPPAPEVGRSPAAATAMAAATAAAPATAPASPDDSLVPLAMARPPARQPAGTGGASRTIASDPPLPPLPAERPDGQGATATLVDGPGTWPSADGSGTTAEVDAAGA